MPGRALVTFGLDDHAELHEISLPLLERFADRHGYTLLIPDWDEGPQPQRAHSWWKIPALASALEHYDEALWVDADCVIVDGREDLTVPAEAWQAMVAHHTLDGIVPNCGFWLVRQPMRPFLQRVWSMTQHLHSPWWEQSALVELLGYDPATRPLRHLARTVIFDRTCWLDPGWNRHKNDTQPASRIRVQHATMYDDRARVMRQWARRAQ